MKKFSLHFLYALFADRLEEGETPFSHFISLGVTSYVKKKTEESSSSLRKLRSSIIFMRCCWSEIFRSIDAYIILKYFCEY